MPEHNLTLTREEFIKRIQVSLANVFDGLPPLVTIHDATPYIEHHDVAEGRINIKFTLDVLMDKTWGEKP